MLWKINYHGYKNASFVNKKFMSELKLIISTQCVGIFTEIIIEIDLSVLLLSRVLLPGICFCKRQKLSTTLLCGEVNRVIIFSYHVLKQSSTMTNII